MLLIVCLVVLGATPVLDDIAVLAKAEKKLGLEFTWQDLKLPTPTPHGSISGKEALRKEIEKYAPLLVSELSLYPKEIFGKVGLKKIVLCADLAFEEQRRQAIPEFSSGVLYFEVRRANDRGFYNRKVVHHEFFHMIDWKDDFKLYEDADWAKLNPAGFVYGKGGASVLGDATQSLLDDSLVGFLTAYSLSGVEEDKAELLAHMIVSPEIVKTRAKGDVIIRAKVERMKKLLKDFTPKMDNEFWKRVDKVNRKDAPEIR